jgi:predicted metal-dependent hydrolase
MTDTSHKLSFGTHGIDFQVVRRDRRTMQISVLPDMTVEVVAPRSATDGDILKRMNKRASWICRQIQFFRQFHPRTPERRFLAGETHLYLGRHYRLKIVRALQSEIKLKGGYIEVHTRDPSRNELVRRQVEEWIKSRAHERFESRLAVCLGKFPIPRRHQPLALVVRQLKQRWGSMTAAGRLVLNRSLIQASVYEIDYVITHELCHREHHHHGPEFFDLLNRVMPDWKPRKRSLERRLA